MNPNDTIIAGTPFRASSNNPYYQPPIQSLSTDSPATVATGSPATWVSGSPRALAALATVTAIFDLGVDWDQYPLAQIAIQSSGSSSGFSGVQVTSGASAVDTDVIPLKNIADTTAFSAVLAGAVTTASGGGSVLVHPMKRFLNVTVTNADAVNAQGATSFIRVGMYPH